MPGPTLPHGESEFENLVDDADGVKVIENDRSIQQYFGNLVDADIHPAAALKGTKISSVAGDRIPFDRIEDDAVTAAKLRDSATDDLERAVTADHIRDGAAVNRVIGAEAVTGQKFKARSFPWTPGGSIPALDNLAITTGRTPANSIPLALVLERSGGDTSPDGFVNMKIYLNTATNDYRILLWNPDNPGPLSLAGMTFRFWYLEMT